ncbi:MAG: nucleotidyltransferase family protein [Xanthomonadales bacterium]|nr:nucleotidyltransferase family protein [Xanthomonadales bacterium]
MISHGAIVLAAGTSRRLGQPKQQLQLDGQTLEARACSLAAATQPQELLLVRRPVDQTPLPALRLQRIVAPPGGMGLSLATAVGASRLNEGGWLVLLVDQPALNLPHLQALLAAWRVDPEYPVASAYAGQVGVPALLPYHWRDRLLRLDGDVGARHWLRQEPGLTAIDAPELSADIDRPEDLPGCDRGP